MPEQTTPGVRTAKLRVPAVEIDSGDPIVGPIFRVMQDRGAGPLHIHRVLANAPLAYQGFSTFAAALRGPGATPRTDRELAILLTALLKDSSYEFVQHRRIGLSVGLTPQQIDSLTDWREAGCYSPRQQLILALTDGMVTGAGLGAATAQAVQRAFSPQEIVELVLISAFYVAVAQFTHAIHIEPETVQTTYGEELPGHGGNGGA